MSGTFRFEYSYYSGCYDYISIDGLHYCGASTAYDEITPAPFVLTRSMRIAFECDSSSHDTGGTFCWTGNGAWDGSTTCYTEDNEKCVFPFKFEGHTITECTTIDGDAKPWCSTLTDSSGTHVTGNWGYCNSACLGVSKVFFGGGVGWKFTMAPSQLPPPTPLALSIAADGVAHRNAH